MQFKNTYSDTGLYTVEDSLDIIADDGRVLYTLDLKRDGSLEIHTSGTVKHNDVILNTDINITSKGGNWFKLSRTKWS